MPTHIVPPQRVRLPWLPPLRATARGAAWCLRAPAESLLVAGRVVQEVIEVVLQDLTDDEGRGVGQSQVSAP